MLRDEFNIRVCEIEKYFLFLQKVEEDYKIITDYSKTNDFRIDDDLSKILKANGFLLLYNLMESTLFNSIVEIFDELKRKGVDYKSISSELKKFWLKTKYKNQEETHLNTSQKFYKYIEDIINNLPVEVLINRIDYGGSLNAKKIRDFSVEIGLNFSDPHYKDYPTGRALELIKDYRNRLAHGSKTFTSIGRDHTFSGIVKSDTTIAQLGLEHFKELTIEHLTAFVNSVENYIQCESYRIKNPSQMIL